MLELITDKKGLTSHNNPQDTQRPNALYDINPDFQKIIST